MATKVNRAATAANKRGGNRKRRNQAPKLLRLDKGIFSEVNQKAFKVGRHETMARRRNATTAIEEESGAAGVPEGRGYTSKRRLRSIVSERGRPSSFRLVSSVFAKRREIPEQYTAAGGNLSPPLEWGKPPPGTEELVLLCEDVDEGFVHWLVYRIPPNVTGLPEGIAKADQIKDMPGGPLQGKNSDGKIGYTGPNPRLADPWHHYQFKLFALEVPLKNLRPGMTKEAVFEKMRAHILDETELTARYQVQGFRKLPTAAA